MLELIDKLYCLQPQWKRKCSKFVLIF